MAARRQWAGTTPEERRATRRRALLDAGIAALGAIDGPALTIRTVCRSSGVSERNFYEEFGDRDDFVRAVYQDVLESVMRVVTEFAAEGDDLETRAVETFIGATVDNPVYGRVLMVAPFTEPTLAAPGSRAPSPSPHWPRRHSSISMTPDAAGSCRCRSWALPRAPSSIIYGAIWLSAATN